MGARLLCVDDDAAVCRALTAVLAGQGFDVACANSGDDALALLRKQDFDAAILDLNMPGMSGLELCRRAHALRASLPIVLVTAFGSMQTAVDALRAGVSDFVVKPVQIPELLSALERTIEPRSKHAKGDPPVVHYTAARRSVARVIGASVVMKEMYALLERLAPSDATVLILGESGTGKELVARALHEGSRRRAGPFVAVNCAAVPETMLESELFGHVRGAFTDATAGRKGLFTDAHGGTLFLDEIGEMSLTVQVKLLRALQERKVRPVGSDREVPFDVRVLSATSRDLEDDVVHQRFRSDLHYRVNVTTVEVPPLRARGDDVLLMAEHFITEVAQRSRKKVAGMAPAVADALRGYPWPGNVRELQNCMERAVALARNDCITADDLSEQIAAGGTTVFPAPEGPFELLPMVEVEKRYVLHVLQAMNGCKARAATSLGFDRRTLYRKLKLYGVY